MPVVVMQMVSGQTRTLRLDSSYELRQFLQAMQAGGRWRMISATGHVSEYDLTHVESYQYSSHEVSGS